MGELILTSHLRGLRRATFRDVRSALAWLITGDNSCEQVHLTREDNADPSHAQNALIHDLAFASSSGDYLVGEWSQLDPAWVASPEVERHARAKALGQIGIVAEEVIQAVLRRAFFDLNTDGPTRDEVRCYRYLNEFMSILLQSHGKARDRILSGLSRIAGAFGYRDGGLAVGERQGGEGWAVLKTLPTEEFQLQVKFPDPSFVESVPDSLFILHSSGASLRLPLDTAELVLRAADGEVLADADSDAVIQEVESFASKLKRQRADAALIIDPAGVPDRVRISRSVIERVQI